MEIFGKMKDSISVAGQGVSQKAKTATESMKISNAIKANDKMIEKLIHQVGLQCVERHVNETDSEYAELFAEILRLRKENQEKHEMLRQLNSSVTCPKCGFGNTASAKFCISCGSPLSAPQPQPQAVKFCTNCDAGNAMDSMFCTECGTPFAQEEPAESAPVQAEDAPVQTESIPVESIPEEVVQAENTPAESTPEETVQPEEAPVTATEAETIEPAPMAQPVAEPASTAGYVCKNCGTVLGDDCLFCTECGTKRD